MDDIYRYDINSPWLRHGPKYAKYKKCFSMIIMYFLCVSKHFSANLEFFSESCRHYSSRRFSIIEIFLDKLRN